MLETKWDTYYCNTEYRTEGQMDHSYLYTTDEKPYDIHDDCKASAVVRSGCHLMTERPQGKGSHLDKLDSERNAYYGNTCQKTYNPILDGNQESSQYKPKNVS